jgi:catalase-peroxidase
MSTRTGKCPVAHGVVENVTLGGEQVRQWWPEQLNLRILQQNTAAISPVPADFDYSQAFSSLDLAAVKADIREVMRCSQEWWPADYGHYGPLFIRMAWHAAGTYRLMDGRGGGNTGNQRFAPVNSWPDNVNLDKARRLLWPVKKKHGDAISWADLIILAGNVALEDMGFQTLGFGGGRVDIWEPEIDTWWGPEEEWLADERHPDGDLLNPLAADHMGLIYVNPEGPNGEPNVLKSAEFIRRSFARMGMDDEETVALIAGGHTFGKTHGADSTDKLGPEPEAAPLEEMGLGWKGPKGAEGVITSGLEGVWTPTPTKWDNSFLELLFKYEWNLVKSPGGAWQWEAVNPAPEDMVPDPFDAGKKRAPVMLTTDLALKLDPVYRPIAERFRDDPEAFAQAFARAWFKLTHRDMGPKSRYLGAEVPREDFIWQDPLPAPQVAPVSDDEVATLKGMIAECGVPGRDLAYVAFSAAATYRDSDKRGGANGARIRLAPQKDWPVHEPDTLLKVLAALEEVRADFNRTAGEGRGVSLADVIVLGGVVAVEQAALAAGHEARVPFVPGRVDAGEEHTDAEAFRYLEPVACGFRNYVKPGCETLPFERLLVDKAHLLTLSVPEMTVLVGGLRALGCVHENSGHGVLTERPGMLTNDFFVNICDMSVEWTPVAGRPGLYEAISRDGGAVKWTATRFDLVFGANSQLRAQSEYYAQDDKAGRFVRDFITVWHKLMMLDRFDVTWR